MDTFMKVTINDWSVVPSPIGVSLRPMAGDRCTDPEVCIHIKDDFLSVSVHLSITDEPVLVTRLDLNSIHNLRK